MPAHALILGGARSGKSVYAEALARKLASRARSAAPDLRDARLVYLATAEILDDEMRDRVARHQQRRGPEWRLAEAPRDAARALGEWSAPGRVVLVDCLTLWLSNMMLSGADVESATRGMIEAIAAAPGPVVAVSNEIGMGVVPDNALARSFRDAQGRLNQGVAAKSDLVVFMAAGLPMVLKGEAPE